MTSTDGTTARRPAPRLAETLHHDLWFPTEVLAGRVRVRELADRVVAPAAARIASGDESIDGYPRDVVDALAAEGPCRIPFAAGDGGDGLLPPATATAVGVDELAHHSNSVAATSSDLSPEAVQTEAHREHAITPVTTGGSGLVQVDPMTPATPMNPASRAVPGVHSSTYIRPVDPSRQS